MNDAAGQRAQVGTTSDDYAATYYATHLGGSDEYSWESESWREFFVKIADRILAVAPARRVLDVGCARGLLVQALAERSVDARGLDVSEHAISTAHPDVRDRLWVGSATAPIEDRYDLITCIEVLEHMAPADAQDAIDRMTAATDRIVFSSSPTDLAEPTHINVHENRQWIAWFADRGFYRRTDVDLGFLTPWAVLLERGAPTTRELVHRYEETLNPLLGELLAKRDALLAAQREIEHQSRLLDGGGGIVDAAEVARWEDEVLRTRHEMLVMRDHVVGVEAQLGRANRDLIHTRELYAATVEENSRLGERKEINRETIIRLRKRVAGLRARQRVLRRKVVRLERDLAAAQVPWTRRLVRRVRGR